MRILMTKVPPLSFSYLGQLVVGFIKSDLEVLDFLSIVSDITVGLVGLPVVFLGGVLELLDGGVQACNENISLDRMLNIKHFTVSLGLQALHLLPDGVHGVSVGCSEQSQG